MVLEATTSPPIPVAHAVLRAGEALGSVWVLFRDAPWGGALALRAFDDLPDEAARGAIAGELGLDRALIFEARTVPDAIAGPLRDFAAGRPVDLASVPVEITGTPFQRAIYAALRRVPRGRVRTYAGLAADAGRPRAMRAVGQAMARNPLPLVVPCHRVVAHDHGIGGYTGGVARKRALLELEGVRVDAGRVIPGQLELLGR